MKHIVLGLDFDGCILTQNYTYPFTPEKVGDIKTNTSILDSNSELWAFIIDLCTKNPDLEKLTFAHFSLRQNAMIDMENSKNNHTESFFLAMIKIETHVANLLKTHAPQVKVELNHLLMPDIYSSQEIGHTRSKALEDIDYSLAGRGMINIKQEHNDYLYDNSKVTFVFAHVQAIEADAFYYFDDVDKIHQSIDLFYNNKIGAGFIPKDVVVNSYLYYEGRLTNEPRCTIIGTGQRCSKYGDMLRVLGHNSHSFPIFDVENKETHSLIEKFHQIRQIFHDPLTGAQHTMLQSALIQSIVFSQTWSLQAREFKIKKLTPLQKSLAECSLENIESRSLDAAQRSPGSM